MSILTVHIEYIPTLAYIVPLRMVYFVPLPINNIVSLPIDYVKDKAYFKDFRYERCQNLSNERPTVWKSSLGSLDTPSVKKYKSLCT